MVLMNMLVVNLIHPSMRLMSSSWHFDSGLLAINFNKDEAILVANPLVSSTLAKLLKSLLDDDHDKTWDKIPATKADDVMDNPLQIISFNSPFFSMSFIWERPYFSLL